MLLSLFLYNLLIALTAPVWMPLFLVHNLRRGRHGIGGGFTRADRANLAGRRVIWLHAVSLGESIAGALLYRALAPQMPDHAWVTTASTPTGHAMQTKLLPDSVMKRCFPLDLPWSMRRAINRTHPELLILVETEIWPNLLAAARSREIKTALVSGRFSDHSAAWYRRFHLLLKPFLGCLDLALMQTSLDAARIIAAGAPPVRVCVLGNLKFDLTPMPAQGLDRAALHLGEGPSLVAGSTHEGEEAELLKAFALIRRSGPAVLILAPRHLERLASVKEILSKTAWRWGLRSEAPAAGADKLDVLLLDSYGELASFYDLATVVFIGGSLAPIGGHNPIEASALARPVLFGPHMENFREAKDLLLAAGAARVTVNAAGIAEAFLALAGDPDEAGLMGKRGLDAVARNRGASSKTATRLAALIGGENV